MKFNYSKLNGKIVEVYGTRDNFANAFGMSKNTVSRKLNNKVRFSPEDIIKICELLNIPNDKISDYFFTKEV